MTCAYAVRGALQKISGVESVDVSLNKGLAGMKLKPGNTVKLGPIWETIKKSGFTTKDTRVVARGKATAANGKLHFKLTGIDQVFPLVADPKAPQILERVKKHLGRTIIIGGRVTTAAIEVQTIREPE